MLNPWSPLGEHPGARQGPSRIISSFEIKLRHLGLGNILPWRERLDIQATADDAPIMLSMHQLSVASWYPQPDPSIHL